MKSRLALMVLALIALVGCSPEYPEISSEVAKQFKAGVTLEEVRSKLGEPHAPTSFQLQQLDATISRMPENMRANASNDRSVAWGTDKRFFVGKVNSQGVVWVTGWKDSGQ